MQIHKHASAPWAHASPCIHGDRRSASNDCAFWYIEFPAHTGSLDEARAIFKSMLACRNRAGLLDDSDPETGELVDTIGWAVRPNRLRQSSL
jgi:hypothetical protein